MEENISVWYDAEGDYLEVIFVHQPGYFRETDHDAVMEKVDAAGHIIGFSILAVSQLKGKPPLSIALTP